MADLSAKTDEELAHLVQSGNQAAFAILIERYQAKLLRYLIRITGHKQNAEDLLQDTFIRIYQNIQSFNVKRKFSPWAYRIAHNLAINFIKKNKRQVHSEHETIDWLKFQNGEVEDLLGEHERREEAAELIISLETLKENYKEILILHYFEEKSYDEISDIMRVPKNTVGVWLKRAKDQLKKVLEKQALTTKAPRKQSP